MDKKTKSILVIIVVILLAAVALYWIFKFWWTFIVAALAFGIGYFVGRANKGSKKK